MPLLSLPPNEGRQVKTRTRTQQAKHMQKHMQNTCKTHNKHKKTRYPRWHNHDQLKLCIRNTVVNITRYAIWILRCNTIRKKIYMYLIYNTIGLYILQYNKRSLQYTICILWYIMHYDTLTRLINRFLIHLNEPFELNIEYKFWTRIVT